MSPAEAAVVERYVAAFERYDVEALTSLLTEDATLSMPPFTLWLCGHDSIHRWMAGPGSGCRGSKLLATSANGLPAFGQYKPAASGDGYEPWALQVVEMAGDEIVGICFFLDTARLFPLFGLPLTYEG